MRQSLDANLMGLVYENACVGNRPTGGGESGEKSLVLTIVGSRSSA